MDKTNVLDQLIEQQVHLADELQQAVDIVRKAEQRAIAGDVGAPLETFVIEALRTVKASDNAEFHRLRAALKRANKDVSVTAIDKAIRGDSSTDDRSVADLLVDLARDHCDLFHDPDREAHACFTSDGHRECWHLQSLGFREWLSHQFYKEHGVAPNDAPLAAALNTLAGQAKFEGDERLVAVRVAKHGDDYYVDLCNESWQAVRITTAGWQVIDSPPIMFIRTSAMRPLPDPTSGGSLGALWEFANIEEPDRALVLAWMCEAMRPDTPYPIIELVGEQGSAKSDTQSVIRDLIDPNRANLRAKPKCVDDLFVTARASHCTSLENLSHLAPEFQDALCALATGSGYGGRALYTNAEETVFEVKKPILMNGIAVVATQQDLIDRTLLVSLPTITMRRTESDLQERFNTTKGEIFGALLDLFAKSLAMLNKVRVAASDLPRMADFALLGEAVFRVLGHPAGEFMSRYNEKRKHGVQQTIEASPVASAALAWLESNPAGYQGTVKTLHGLLTPFKPDGEAWPKSLKGFADSLRRMAPALRLLGFDVRYLGHQRDGHHWAIKPVCVRGKNYSTDGHDGHNGHASAICDHRDHGDHGSRSSSPEKTYPEDYERASNGS